MTEKRICSVKDAERSFLDSQNLPGENHDILDNLVNNLTEI
jgi:hypothetical protein